MSIILIKFKEENEGRRIKITAMMVESMLSSYRGWGYRIIGFGESRKWKMAHLEQLFFDRRRNKCYMVIYIHI